MTGLYEEFGLDADALALRSGSDALTRWAAETLRNQRGSPEVPGGDRATYRASLGVSSPVAAPTSSPTTGMTRMAASTPSGAD
jgi:hypothetical protein